MADIRKKEIGGREYQILIPSARKSMKLAEKASLIMGPLIVPLFKDAKQGMSNFSAALMGADSEAVDTLLMSAASTSNLSFEGKNIADTESAFDIFFHDKRKDVFPVLTWCLWENIKDFLPDLEAYVQIIKARFGTMETGLKSQENG